MGMKISFHHMFEFMDDRGCSVDTPDFFFFIINEAVYGLGVPLRGGARHFVPLAVHRLKISDMDLIITNLISGDFARSGAGCKKQRKNKSKYNFHIFHVRPSLFHHFAGMQMG